LLDGIREEWEDWQHDVMLQQLQAGLAGRGRGRGRGKRDEVDLMNVDELGPRKVRVRGKGVRVRRISCAVLQCVERNKYRGQRT
jgi:hypothetical protein